MAETTAVLTGASILPPAPVHLAAEARDDGGVTLRWRRRGRTGWRWRDGTDTPLGEEREQYRVTIADGASFTTDTPFLSLPAGDLGARPATIGVAQIGTNGASPPATITI